MFVAHAVPRVDDAEILADGRSSILFATLAGVSLGLMTGAARPISRGNRTGRATSIVLRALILFLVGVLLSTIGSEIAIILDYYAVMFLLLLPVLFAPRRVLAAIAAVLAVAAPLLASAVDGPGPVSPDLIGFAETYLLTGYYPALIWLPFLITGLICARSGLTRPRTQVWMMVGGACAALGGYGAAAILPEVSAEAHSGSTAEVIGSGGVAIAVIGILLWLTSEERATVGRILRTILWPIAATGAMALTVYTLQIVTLAIFARLRDDTGGAVEYPGWPLLIGMSIASILFASGWRALFGTGPFERLMAIMTRTPKRMTPDAEAARPSERFRGTASDRERLDPPLR